ncbi:hypothetical protein J1N35_029888 [Gossypium stocksii]|uniref:Uncharacterized protein n=1 Tax=Gossypium stocksii TaxID=47602 RepID=A0A9D3UYS3_9ROSI|nr:hypothetical protein J1N35_029888 [Gossypium stocksii]
MEVSQKINGKKRLPSIPSNYVTLLQLQERWIKEKEGKQKGKEEKQETQQKHEEKETNFEERVNDEVSGRESRKNRQIPLFDRGNGKHVAEGKPRDEKTAAAKDFDNEKKGKELKKRWKSKNKKRNEMKEKARAANEGEELTGGTSKAPLPTGVEHSKGEEKLIGDELQAPELASVEEENIEARRELGLSSIPRTHDRTEEIGRKFQAMSMNGEIRRGDHRRYGEQNVHLNYRGGKSERNRRYNGVKFDRRGEGNQRNEGMAWVRKGEFKDQNVSAIQSSSCSSKD